MVARRARRKPGENRERLIEAGLIEFGLYGFHGASTAAIARRADVPQPHVYASFRTKLDLFIVCFGRAASRLSGVPSSLDIAVVQRFLFQAYAAAATPQVSQSLGTELLELRNALGESFGAVLAGGADFTAQQGLRRVQEPKLGLAHPRVEADHPAQATYDV